jgi:lipopolysaccharide export system permease protein
MALPVKIISASLTEANMRYSFSFACITFCLVGIPLGVTAQRRETSVGFALSLIVATCYIVFIIFANTLNENPKAYPHLLMWIPNVIFIAVGAALFRKLMKK